MFGFVTTNSESLSQEEKARYQAAYCGLCRALSQKYGGPGRVTLTYDMTFLSLLLSSLYRLEEETGSARCPVNPLRKCDYAITEATNYAADINVILAYYKCLDDWQDDHSIIALGELKLLEAASKEASGLWPRQAEAIRRCLEQLAALERDNDLNPDNPANCFGRLMGEIFLWREEDEWSGALRHMGAALGRFVYMMDAVVDLRSDLKKQRYNPLTSQVDMDFTPMLSMLIGECTWEFEQLPLERDLGILRNILYAGVWMKYGTKQNEEGADKA